MVRGIAAIICADFFPYPDRDANAIPNRNRTTIPGAGRATRENEFSILDPRVIESVTAHGKRCLIATIKLVRRIKTKIKPVFDPDVSPVDLIAGLFTAGIQYSICNIATSPLLGRSAVWVIDIQNRFVSVPLDQVGAPHHAQCPVPLGNSSPHGLETSLGNVEVIAEAGTAALKQTRQIDGLLADLPVNCIRRKTQYVD